MPRRHGEASGSGRRWFGPAAVLGVVACGLSALAGGQPWAASDGGGAVALVDHAGGHVPLAAALGLAGLACWGVLLVTRGLLRRAVSLLTAVCAVGLLATAVGGRSSALDSARQATIDVGGAPTASHTTAWWYVGLLGAVLALYAAALAVRHVRSWPEMGSRYDAPTTPAAGAIGPAAEMEDLELWRAIDEGRDPTDRPDH